MSQAIKQARIAFVGAGVHSTESLYPNIAHIPEFNLVAVCDLDRQRAERAARVYGALESYTDLTNMLDKVAPDGVCVCGTPELHHQAGLECLKRGIPVFLEKPPASTLAGAQELVDAARARGVWGMVAFMKRFAPANVVAKEYLESGECGRLSSITAIHGSGPYDDVRRMMFFNGIHLLDLARFFAGEVRSVYAFAWDALPTAKAVAACMEFASGVVGHLNMNSGGTWTDCFEQVYLSAEATQVVVENSHSVEVISPRSRFAEAAGWSTFGWSRRYYVSHNQSGWAAGAHYTRGYWGEMSHFARAVLGQVQPTPTLEDGLEDIRLIDAILLSAQVREPVEVASVS